MFEISSLCDIRRCSYQNDNYLTTMVPVEGSSGLLYPNHYKRFTLEMFTFVDHTLSPQKDRGSPVNRNATGKVGGGSPFTKALLGHHGHD
ncbi:unnamed protein product [Coregonus sp. 'balchen']|nr:unnamed protein product [Coregonus sp. 'balchen']